jgi:hypothetical protein
VSATRVASAFALLCALGVAHAQAPGNASLSYEALAKAAPGAWAEYALGTGEKNVTTMRYSLVEKTKDKLAMEIETTMPPLVMRMDFVANGAAAWKLARIRMKMGTGAVQDVPTPEGAEQIIKKGGSFGALVGDEKLKTPAGEFACKHYRQKTEQGEGEVWMSDAALPAGLVQSTVAALGAKITIAKTGSGAKAKIQ